MTVKTGKRWTAVGIGLSATLALNALIVGEIGWLLVFGFFFVVGLMIYGSLGPERVIVERQSMTFGLGQCGTSGPSGSRCTYLPGHRGAHYDTNRGIAF